MFRLTHSFRTLTLFTLWATPLPAAQEVGSQVTRGISGEAYGSLDSDRDITLFLLTVDRIMPVTKWLSVIGASSVVVPVGTRTPEDSVPPVSFNARTVGVRLLAAGRVHPLALGPARPFLEAGFGMVFTARAFPPGGTPWNFTQRWGVGVDVLIGGGVGLQVGAYRVHVSNGKGFGHPNNPAYDGRGLTFGIFR